jgi:DNA (cytosine-5)-methyltransferase 1
MEFREWLMKEKQYSERASRDVQSRLKRALSLSGENEISQETLTKIESNEEFKSLSMSVKSQIRRAVKFYQEYLSSKN